MIGVSGDPRSVFGWSLCNVISEHLQRVSWAFRNLLFESPDGVLGGLAVCFRVSSKPISRVPAISKDLQSTHNGGKKSSKVPERVSRVNIRIQVQLRLVLGLQAAGFRGGSGTYRGQHDTGGLSAMQLVLEK